MKNELEEGELANKIQKESYKVPVESLNPQPIAIAEPM